MTSHISIGNYRLKIAEVKYRKSVHNFTDSCSIYIPKASFLRTAKDKTEDIQQGSEEEEYAIKKGDKVSVSLGYDNNNMVRFVGFVKTINQAVPVEIVCEGYSMQLYSVRLSRTYLSTTVVELLQDITTGTLIQLHSQIPAIPLKNIRFKDATGIKVLEWLQNECKLSVYFIGDKLYVGSLFATSGATQKLRIGWNTVSESDFKRKEPNTEVRIQLREKDNKGDTRKYNASADIYKSEKLIKIKHGLDKMTLQNIANRLQNKENYIGYEGKIECFLEPFFEKGMIADVSSLSYPDMNGKYFVEAIEGYFGKSGARQIIQLGYFYDGK